MTIGEQLKQKRIELGLSLEDISNDIKISSKILEKIENNEPQPTIAPAILKGFIRSYCKHLRIEADTNLISNIGASAKVQKKDIGQIESGEDVSTMSWLKWAFAGVVLIVAAVGAKVVQKYKAETYSHNNQAISNFESLNVGKSEAAITPIPAPVLAENMGLSQNINTTATTTQQSEIDKDDLPESNLSTSNSSTESEKTLKAPTNTYKEVILEAKKDTSVRIKSQGKVAIEKPLESGKFYLFREAIPLTVKSDDPSALQIIVNGRILHSPKNANGPVIVEIKE